MDTTTQRSGPAPTGRQNQRLWAEFVGLFVAPPVLLAVFLPPSAMFLVLLAVTVLGIVLLNRTPSFQWRELSEKWSQIDWRIVLGFAAVTAVANLALVALVMPEAFLNLFRLNPAIWLMVMVLYPFVSALPQEIVFRPLFFRRFGPILPRGVAALIMNAAIFSLAHLLYWNWIVSLMTFVGGLIFAWAYEVRRSFPLAVVLHAVAGDILFTVGTGMLFFTGTVVRPF